MILTYLFIFLAAICNALMDRVENENFYVSVFKGLNPKFWYKRESWKGSVKIFNFHVDAWHIAKSLMIICFAAAISKSFIEFCIIGVIWNLTFNLFYNKIFKK